jgi:hypothetical protein
MRQLAASQAQTKPPPPDADLHEITRALVEHLLDRCSVDVVADEGVDDGVEKPASARIGEWATPTTKSRQAVRVWPR